MPTPIFKCGSRLGTNQTSQKLKLRCHPGPLNVREAADGHSPLLAAFEELTFELGHLIEVDEIAVAVDG